MARIISQQFGCYGATRAQRRLGGRKRATAIRSLLASGAGLREIEIRTVVKQLRLPPPADFMWQYVHSTPLADVVAEVDDERKRALERDVRDKWQPFVQDGGLGLEVRMTTLSATK